MADSLKAVVLRGAGLEAHVSPLGATLTKLLAPDRAGVLAGARRAAACACVYVLRVGVRTAASALRACHARTRAWMLTRHTQPTAVLSHSRTLQT